MTLGDILSGDFLKQYIKQGWTLYLSAWGVNLANCQQEMS
jgi:hypothetical protein